jgi:dTDP-4-amino-4,6-dideoxy-D-galactose acyltransferase
MKKLDWDSNFFDFPVFQCNIVNEITLENIKEIRKHIAVFSKALVYIVSQKVCNFQTDGLYLMPAKITYELDLSEVNFNFSVDPPNIEIVSTPIDISQDLIELAFLSGEHSRFKIDAHFTKDNFQRLYLEWLKKSINIQIADECFLINKNGIQIGFVTVKIYDQVAEIGLIAVNRKYQGLGLGGALLKRIYNYANQRGCIKIRVNTQETNKNACIFYEKNRFKITEKSYYSHFWRHENSF